MLLKERQKGREDKEEDVISCWMTLRKVKNLEFEKEITKSLLWRTCFRRGYVPSQKKDYSIDKQIKSEKEL
jgi:hypothetical protein